MTPEILARLHDHAVAVAPLECCGVVIEKDGLPVYWPCGNLAPGLHQAIPQPFDLVAAEEAGRLLGYCHSHVEAPLGPTNLDKYGCFATELPWWIVQLPTGQWTRLDPESRPLVGRQYVFGVDDCYSIIRNWFALEKNVELPDFSRSEYFWEEGTELHTQHMEEAGFHEVSMNDVRRGDVMLFKLGVATITHGGIFMGDGTMLHHIEGGLSGHVQLNDKWIKRLAMVARYK